MDYYELIEKTGEELNEYLKKYITGEAEFYELFDRFEEVYGKNKETVLIN